jgi:hypothetical protein
MRNSPKLIIIPLACLFEEKSGIICGYSPVYLDTTPDVTSAIYAGIGSTASAINPCRGHHTSLPPAPTISTESASIKPASSY